VSDEYVIKKQNREVNLPLIAVNFSTENDIYHDVVLGLQGRHQVTNALTAVNLAETLREYGFDITKENIWVGLECAKHKGRLEFSGKYLFDGAHNISGAKALREYLDEFVNQPITMIFGAMRDKDLAEITEILFPKAQNLILMKVDNPRSVSIEELSVFVPDNLRDKKFYFTRDAATALTIADHISAETDLICITGSLYLVGEIQKFLRENQTQLLTD